MLFGQSLDYSKMTTDELIDVVVKEKTEKIELAKKYQSLIQDYKALAERNNQLLTELDEKDKNIINCNDDIIEKNDEIVIYIDIIQKKNDEIIKLREEKKNLQKDLLKGWKMRFLEFDGHAGIGLNMLFGESSSKLVGNIGASFKINPINNFYAFLGVDWLPCFSDLSLENTNLFFYTGVGFKLYSNF
jgi:hypothetical protein